MKKIVMCLILIGGLFPIGVLAEENTSASSTESETPVSTVESTIPSAIDETNLRTGTATSEDVTESSASKTELNVIKTSLFLFQGEKLTAEMLQANMHEGHAPYDNVKLLEEASTEKTGTNYVKASYTAHGPGGSSDNTAIFEYQVIARKSAEEEVISTNVTVMIDGKLTADMLQKDAKENNKPYANFKLLEVPVTDKLGPQIVRASFTVNEEKGSKEATALFKYLVIHEQSMNEEDLMPTSILLYQGDTLSTDMLEANAHFHHASYDNFKFLGTPTDRLGINYVKASFTNNTPEGKIPVTKVFRYTVIENSAAYDIQFDSFDESTNTIRGRVLSKNGEPVPNVSIFGDGNQVAATLDFKADLSDIKQMRPYTTKQTITDRAGYFTLEAGKNAYFMALDEELGTYSAVTTITDNKFGTQTPESKEKPEGKTADKASTSKKSAFPNTGEKNRFFLSVIGLLILVIGVVTIYSRKRNSK